MYARHGISHEHWDYGQIRVFWLCVPIMVLCLSLEPTIAADSIPTSNTKTAIALVTSFKEHALSPRSAAVIVGPDVTIERQGRNWEIVSKQRGIRCVLQVEDQETVADMADVHIELEYGLVLENLKRAFGPWKLVHSSKTSSVQFRFEDARVSGETVLFARLFTPKPASQSPVVALTLRRIGKLQ